MNLLPYKIDGYKLSEVSPSTCIGVYSRQHYFVEKNDVELVQTFCFAEYWLRDIHVSEYIPLDFDWIEPMNHQLNTHNSS